MRLFKFSRRFFSKKEDKLEANKIFPSKKEILEKKMNLKNSNIKDFTDDFLEDIDLKGKNSKKVLRNLDTYINTLNNKIFRHNTLIADKLQTASDLEIDKEYPVTGKSNQDYANDIKDFKNSHIRIFSIVSDINRVNILNVTKILKLFMKEMYKEREEYRDGSEEMRRLLLLVFFLIVIFYILQSSKTTKKDVTAVSKLVFKAIMKPDLLDKDLAEIKIPLFERIQIPNLNGTTSLINSKNLILIGNTGIGKTCSLKYYVLKEIEKGNFAFYCDLDVVNFDNIKTIDDLLNILVLKFTPSLDVQKQISQLSNVEQSALIAEFKHLIKTSENKHIVFDNFDLNNHENLIQFINKLNNLDIKTIICTNKSIKLKNDFLRNNFTNFDYKFLEINESNFEKYLLDKGNKFIALKSEKLTEKFTKENLELFKKQGGQLSLKLLTDYIDFNSTLEGFTNRINKELDENLNYLKNYETEKYDFIKNLLKNHKTQNLSEYQEIKSNKSVMSKQELELLDYFETKRWIATRDFNSFRLEKPGLMNYI